MSLGREQELFSRDLCKLLSKAFEMGYEVRIGEVLRTVEQQDIYVKTGRSTTMNSQHLKKTAADLHFMKDEKLCYPEELGIYWQSLDPKNQAGMFWKTFKDAPHFERRV